MISDVSPQGFRYQYDHDAPPGLRLARRDPSMAGFGQGMPTFSVQHMEPEELRFVAAYIDDVRAAMLNRPA